MKQSRELNGAKLQAKIGPAFCLLENLQELLVFACWTKLLATRMDLYHSEYSIRLSINCVVLASFSSFWYLGA